ncbi:hypothetical protein EVAR_59796_1 [Eumeta japonica]|uniref:Uncharacterized protein n=1 Tax=Eumeta variegata TaxID=151549 RepID=A0A4C1YFK0_EUMVA|nr:hypothetical protein EVAR_59796_1 [Eumeta japonica]
MRLARIAYAGRAHLKSHVLYAKKFLTDDYVERNRRTIISARPMPAAARAGRARDAAPVTGRGELSANRNYAVSDRFLKFPVALTAFLFRRSVSSTRTPAVSPA